MDSGPLDLIVKLALVEDLFSVPGDLRESSFEKIDPSADITSHAVFSDETGQGEARDRGCTRASAVVQAKQRGVVSGTRAFARVFAVIDGEIDCLFEKRDGEPFDKGDTIATLAGRAGAILAGERAALNFLSHLSGVATQAHRIASALAGSGVTLLDTRKTLPGLRALEKEAVRHGGGENHRMGLYDMVLIKDNHIDRSGSITEAVRRVRAAHGERYKIEVETRTIDEVQEALAVGVDRIMLDNFSIEDMKAAVNMVGSRIPLEASGGINLKTVRKVALTGVDYISVGEITHSVRALDISLIIEEAP